MQKQHIKLATSETGYEFLLFLFLFSSTRPNREDQEQLSINKPISMMLLVFVIVLVRESLLAIEDNNCCCGCPSPCPLTLRPECGASPSTPCLFRAVFNQSEFVGSCDSIIRLSKKLEGDDFIPIVKDNSYKSLRNGTIQTENILTMEVTHKIPARMRITKFMDTEESTIQKDVNHISGRSAQNLDEIAEKIAFLNQQLTNRLDGLLRSVFGGVTSFLRSRDDILTRN